MKKRVLLDVTVVAVGVLLVLGILFGCVFKNGGWELYEGVPFRSGPARLDDDEWIRDFVANYCDEYLGTDALLSLSNSQDDERADSELVERFERYVDHLWYEDIAVLIAHKADSELKDRIVDACGQELLTKCESARLSDVRESARDFVLEVYGDDEGRALLEEYADVFDRAVAERTSKDWDAYAEERVEQDEGETR